MPSHGRPGVSVALDGRFFGTVTGTVFLRDPVSGRGKSCKVTAWTMDATGGDSTLTFTVPKLPKGLLGRYKLAGQVLLGAVVGFVLANEVSYVWGPPGTGRRRPWRT